MTAAGGSAGSESGRAPDARGAAGEDTVRPGVFLLGLAIGAWATVPAYLSPPLNVSSRVEIADHAIPGLVVVAMAVIALLRRRPAVALVTGLTTALAGLWMFATHVPLLGQSSRGEVPWGTSAYHTVPGLAVLVLGLVWAATHWDAAG